MNPALALTILKLVADGVPVALRIVDTLRNGRQPTQEELQELALYTSDDALTRAGIKIENGQVVKL